MVELGCTGVVLIRRDGCKKLRKSNKSNIVLEISANIIGIIP